MPVEVIASTFEYARDWLVSSPLLVEILLAGGPEFTSEPERIDAAKARIHREEVWIEPEAENAGQTAPDLPPPIYPVPRATVMTQDDRRQLVATQTFAGSGTLRVVVVALVPAEYSMDHAGDSGIQKAAKFTLRREWAGRLAEQIREELLVTAGRSDEGGNPYLTAKTCDVVESPADLDESEPEDGIGWIYEVEWR